jgi:hypothetical protein
MSDTVNKALAWVKANTMKALLIGAVLLVVFFGTKIKRILFAPRRVHHRRPASIVTRRRRSLPRSVGTHRVKHAYNKNGSRKKPWQIAGSPAARRHMAQIRARR